MGSTSSYLALRHRIFRRRRIVDKSIRPGVPIGCRLLTGSVAIIVTAGHLSAQDLTATDTASRTFSSEIKPLLVKYCEDCHSGDVTEGDVDLAAFQTLSDVKQQPSVWLKTREMLNSDQMPPKESNQPNEDESRVLRQWVERFLANEARATAGDPGPVILRRLTNAEYDYSVRDLTGVESLNPTREFPVDGAAGEGFTNVGNGQGMSTALVQKYMLAAKDVSAHVVLLPDGVRFSRATNQRDLTDELLGRIQAYYRRFTADGGGMQVNLDGNPFTTNAGGRLPVEAYLAATLAAREDSRTQPTKLKSIAAERGLSEKYLSNISHVLNAEDLTPILEQIRSRWRTATEADAPELAAEIARWQKSLWKFNAIGQIGRAGGPTEWMESVPPVTSQSLRYRLPTVNEQDDVVVYLAANSLTEGQEPSVVVWQRPRIEFPVDESESAKPPVLLRDVRGAIGESTDAESSSSYGLAAEMFGLHPDGMDVDAADLCLAGPQVLEIRLPAKLAAGAELVAIAGLQGNASRDGSLQVQVLAERPQNLGLSPDVPVLVGDSVEGRDRAEAALNDFRELFPPALCYAKIVPVDEVVTLTLFHREDGHLRRLMLDEQQTTELDELWDELRFVSEEPLKQVVVYEQLVEFATQDRPDLVDSLAPLREPIAERAEAFRQRQLSAELSHLESVLHFAGRAWRRPLTESEQQSLCSFYQQLRDESISHDEAIRLLVTRVLTSPAFLFKLEQPGPGETAVPVTDVELATRLSYTLWSSAPDDELRQVAESGRLSDDDVLLAQTQRMLDDDRTRRLAIQFACQWLHLRDFDQQNDKNEELFPEFAKLRGEMYEETVRFLEDMFRNNGSLLDLIDADHTFLNEPLSRHYGIDSVTGDEWQRVDGMRARGRGGILGMATFLASQSGASRTSPILRGTWVSETLLGERLPKPPPGVPQLPETVPSGLTARQLIEQHSSAPECATCHRRIDPYGFALEQFDAIGRLRPEQVDTQTTVLDGTKMDGLNGLRSYLLKERRDDVVRQFCRKLLGFMLGREVQLSDEPLLDQLQVELAANDFRFRTAVEAIVTSRQFRDIRGRLPAAGAARLDPPE